MGVGNGRRQRGEAIKNYPGIRGSEVIAMDEFKS